MSLFEEAVAAGVKLPQAQREHLAQALGLKLAAKTANPLPMAPVGARVDPVAWRKAESGHAVLASENVRDEEIPAGAEAIAGIWSTRIAELLAPRDETPRAANEISLAQIPSGSPVLVHADLCLSLACGEENARAFFVSPGVEIRLATAGYLHLLASAQNLAEQTRLRRFVQPFAVLSLGPMASSRSVELMIEHAQQTGLSPLDALIAATALAHEIPLLARSTQAFADVEGLMVCRIA